MFCVYNEYYKKGVDPSQPNPNPNRNPNLNPDPNSDPNPDPSQSRAPSEGTLPLFRKKMVDIPLKVYITGIP